MKTCKKWLYFGVCFDSKLEELGKVWRNVKMEAFAERLISARKKKSFTQSVVAEKLQVSFQAVSLWERGETFPETGKLTELAELLEVSIDWLLTGKESVESFFEQTDISERIFNEERMYTYIKSYATARGMAQTLRALPFAREKHEGQCRCGKEKIPYIYHPLLVSCHALALGLGEDALVATALLHDVCEDCGVLPEELPVEEDVKEAVILLTKDSTAAGETKEAKVKYFAKISGNKIAIMVKLLDRCNNVSSMALSFKSKRMAEYIKETEEWIYPLFEKANKDYPEYSDKVFLLKYQIVSMVQSLKKQLS